MTERKHIKITDPEGKIFKIYVGIPTIIPKGNYTFNEMIDADFIIGGETDDIIIWSFKEHRWITLEDLSSTSSTTKEERNNEL